MSELTDKTMVLVSRLGDYWVTPDQGSAIMDLKQRDPTGSVNLQGSHLALQVIDGILTAKDYGVYNIKRRGGWQCKYQQWHERNNQCAHGQGLR